MERRVRVAASLQVEARRESTAFLAVSVTEPALTALQNVRFVRFKRASGAIVIAVILGVHQMIQRIPQHIKFVRKQSGFIEVHILVLVNPEVVLILVHWRCRERGVCSALLRGRSALCWIILLKVVGRVQSLQVATHFLEVVDNQPSVLFFREQLFQFN